MREAVYSMMRWWLDRGVDGFRMDVVNMLSKDPALPDGPVRRRRPLRRRLGAAYICGPRIHEFLHEMHGAVFADRDAPPLTVGEMPGVTIDDAVLFTDPARRRGRHGVPVRARRPRPRRQQVGPAPARPARPQGVARALAGRPRRRPAGTACTGATTTSRASSRAGATTAEHRVRSATMLATVLHLHRGTPYVYQGEELGMTNVDVHVDRGVPRHRGAQPLRSAVARGDGPGRRAGRDGPPPRQRPHADAVGRLAARRVHDRHAVDRRQPQPHDDQRRRGAGRRPLGVPPLPAADRAAPHVRRRRRRRLHDAARRPPARVRVHPRRSATRRCSCSATSPATHQPLDGTSTTWAGAEVVLANIDDARGPISGRAAPVGGRRAARRVG